MGRWLPLVLVSAAWSVQGRPAIVEVSHLLYPCQCVGWDGYARSSAHRLVYLPLFWRRCMCGIFFKALFAVRLHACMMGGAFVIRGMVRIGVSLITLCSSSLTLCCSSVTLCFVLGVAVDGGGLRMVCRLDCNNFNRRLPLLVEAATVFVSRNSSVRARRCWCGEMFGIWQCWGKRKSSADPDMRYACVSGTCPLMVQDTNRQRLLMPMTHGYLHLCILPLCIPVAQGGIDSNRMGRLIVRTQILLD